MDDGCTGFESERIVHENLKRQLREGYTCHIGENMEGWKCQTCGRILLSKAGYAIHRKSHRGQFMQTPRTKKMCLVQYVTKSVSQLLVLRDIWWCISIKFYHLIHLIQREGRPSYVIFASNFVDLQRV